MESVAIDAAQGQQSGRHLAAERNQRHRADVRCLEAKQEFALGIANLAAARLAGGEQAVEAAKGRIIGGHATQELLCCLVFVRHARARQHQHRVEGVEVFAQAGFDFGDCGRGTAGTQQPAREAMDFLGQHVIGARHIHELGQFLVLRLDLLAQYLDLALDQRHGRTGTRMLQPQARQ